MACGTSTRERATLTGVLSALPIGLVMPWRACAGAWRDCRLFGSMLIHLGGMVFFLTGLLVIDELLWWGDLKYDVAYALSDEPLLVLLVLVLWAVGIQLMYALVAWVTACWGTQAEPYLQTLGRSLSRWYQLTPFHAVLILLLLVALEVANRFENLLWDYGHHLSMSWEAEQLLTGLAYVVVVLGFIVAAGWSTLRTLAVPRSAAPRYPHCRWPAVCEGCGYALLGLQRDQACPECGKPIHDSLFTPRGTLPGGFVNAMRLALLRPTHLGRHLLTRSSLPGPGRALALTASLLLLTGPVAVVFIGVLIEIVNEYSQFDGFLGFAYAVVVVGLSIGMTTVVIGVLLMLTAGSLAGLVERLFGKRQSLPAAVQAACYTGGWVVGLALLMVLITGVMIVVGEWLANQGSYDFLTLMPLAWIVIAAAGGIVYIVHVTRIVRAARNANV